MAAPAPATAPAGAGRSPWWLFRFLMLAAAVCFLFAALTFGGTRIGDAGAWQWLSGGFCAWALAWAVP